MAHIKTRKQKLSVSNDITELWQGQSLDLLKELHILTREGKLNADSRRKLKQVQHLVQFIEPIIKNLYSRRAENTSDPVIVDVGSGKSYLGFILYDLILRQYKTGRIVSIEARPELVKSASALAQKAAFDRMEFVCAGIEKAHSKAPLSTIPSIDLVCALHACDTATDDAILLGLKKETAHFVLVPCCQAEVARQLEAVKLAPEHAESLWRFPLHRREFGSHLTNVIRTLFLESRGYKVTVTELIGWEHSMKNELILAERTGKPNLRSQEQLESILQMTGVKPKLLGG